MEFSQAPGDLSTPQGPEKNSQDEIHSLVKVKVKPELHFCGQTDDGISWRPGIIIGSAQNCHLKSHPWGRCTTLIFSNWASRLLLTSHGCSSLDVGCQPNLVMYTLLHFYFFSFNDCILKLSQIIFYKKMKLFICV